MCIRDRYILIATIESLRSEAESSAGKKGIFNVSILVQFIKSCGRSYWKWASLEAKHPQHGKFSQGWEKNFLFTMIAVVFVVLKQSINAKKRWIPFAFRSSARIPTRHFHHNTIFNGRRFRTKNFYPDFFICRRVHWPHLVVQVYINNSPHLARKYARIFVLGHYLLTNIHRF